MRLLSAPLQLMILAPCFPLLAQDAVRSNPRFELMGAYAFNTDFIRDLPLLIVADQKVSPFFSNGSGPAGFEASIKRYVRGNLGLKATVSGYFDPGFEGGALYCQQTVCALNVRAKAEPRTFFAMFGPEWKFRSAKRLSPFLYAIGGIVYERSTFKLSGSNVQYAAVRYTSVQSVGGSATQGLLVFTSAGFPLDGTVHYSDTSVDVGLSLGLAGGFDARVSERLSFRASLEYDPTFLVRPLLTDPTLLLQKPNSRSVQNHIALSLGLVWGFR